MRLLLSCLLVVWLAACSSSTPDGPEPGTPAAADRSSPGAAVDETTVREGLAAAFAGDQPGPAAAQEGACFADRLLATTTTEELRASGILDASYEVAPGFPALERPLAEKVVDAQLGCTDFVDDSAQAGLYISKGRLARRAYAACLRRELPEGEVRAAVLAAVMGRWEAPAIDRLSQTQARCAEQAGER